MDFQRLKRYSQPLLRVGLSLVFLWFGINQLVDPVSFLGFLPDWLPSFITPNTAVLLNGFFEVITSLLLITGLFTRITSFLLALHMIGIITSLGYTPVAVRDFGIMLATFSVSLHGPDKYTLDHKLREKEE